jgi:cytoskeletal protein CcmA (bactofilin family)
MATRIQLRRDTGANWSSANPVLAQGEIGLNLDDGSIKIGDGVTAWNSLSYSNLAVEISEIDGVQIIDPQNGDFLRYSTSASAWINDPVNLSTDTVGDYVESLIAGPGVVLSNNTGEAATPTIGLTQDISSSSNVSFVDITSTGKIVPSVGNGDNGIIFPANPGGGSGDVASIKYYIDSAPEDTGLHISVADNETDDIHLDAQNTNVLGNLNVTGTVVGDVLGNLTGNADTASALLTARIIELSGDVTGSASFDGSSNINIAVTSNADSIELGTDTTGNYMVDVVAGTGVTITHTPGEGSTASVEIGQDVSTSASVTFAHVSADIAGNVTGDLTGNADTATTLETARTISLAGDLSGSVSFDGSTNVTITATVEPDSVALGTNTTGNFVNDVVAGTGVTVTHTPGEGSSASIAIGQDVSITASVTFAHVTADVAGNLVGDVTGNADTATALETARTISLAGDLSGSVSFDGTGDVTITATVQPDSVALGTDTTGNFMSDVVAGTGVTVTHTPGESSTASIAIGQDVSTSASVTFGQVTISGDLTVNGTTTTLNTENLLVEDNIVVLNSNVTGSPTANAGIEVERGTSDNVALRWNETTDSWEITEDGTTYKNIAVGQDVETSSSVTFAHVASDVTGNVTGNVTGDLTGNADTATALETARTISLAGDLSGSVSFDGTSDVTVTATVQPDSVALGTDTTGNYMTDVVAGTGVTINHTPGEGSSASIAIGQDVSTSSSVTFAHVSADVTGDLTGNADTASTLETARTISLAGDLSGSVSFDGSSDVTITATVQPDSVALGTDTTGNYVSDVTASTGVTVSHIAGEGSSPVISIGQDVATTASVTFSQVTADITGDLTGNADTATALETARSISLAGDLSGSVSFDGTSDVTITATVLPDSVALGTDTTGNYVNDVTASTGVTISHTPGEGSSPVIAIGQDVSTTASVAFAHVTADLTGDVTGNADTATTLETARAISLAGDLSGSASFDGSSDVTITATVQPNSVALGTDTTGNYMSGVAAGAGISVTHTPGEGSTASVALDAVIDELNDVVITYAHSGQLLEFDGTNWVNAVRPSNEPIGHENKADSVISFDEGSRTFSIAPASTSYTVWCVGKRFVKTGTETVTIPDTSGLYYIYFNASGVLSYRTSFFVWDTDTPTAYIYWNATDDKAYFFADERHGVTLDWATHEYLHRTRGAAIANGFGINNYTTTGDGSSNAHAKFDLADGTFFDEDLQVDIVHSETPTANTWEQTLQGNAEIPVFYKLGSDGHWVQDVATEFAFKQGATPRPTYNLNSGGTWSTPEVTNAYYLISWIIATNNLNNPVLAIMGQGNYSSLGNAEAATWEQLDLTGLPIVEFRPLYKVIYRGYNIYTNSVNARIHAVTDIRQIQSTGGAVPSTPVSDHGSLTGLADDDHPQYLLADGTRLASSLTVTNDLIVNGNFTVNGTTTTLNTETLAVEDNIVVLNANVSASPVLNAGIEIERGTSDNVALRWNEASDRWELTNDGSSYGVIAELGSIALGTDTTGNYLTNVVAGTGVTVTHTPGEGSTASVAIGQSVGTSASVTFAHVSADLTGAVTGNASTATALQTARAISLSGDLSGSVSFDGTGDVTITATVQPDSVALGTDTTGNYMSDIVAGTGVTITHTPGEGSSASVAIGQSVSTSASVTFAAVTANALVGGQSATNISTTSATTVATFDKTVYRTAEFILQISQGSKYISQKVLVVHDGTNVTHTRYGIVELGSPVIPLSVTSDINGDDVRLRVTISDANSTSASIRVFQTEVLV